MTVAIARHEPSRRICTSMSDPLPAIVLRRRRAHKRQAVIAAFWADG
jgi:hypothetical protein